MNIPEDGEIYSQLIRFFDLDNFQITPNGFQFVFQKMFVSFEEVRQEFERRGFHIFLRKKGEENLSSVKYAKSKGVWEQFLKVRSGELKNPCPPEVGLRFAKLMDMIRASARSGKVV